MNIIHKIFFILVMCAIGSTAAAQTPDEAVEKFLSASERFALSSQKVGAAIQSDDFISGCQLGKAALNDLDAMIITLETLDQLAKNDVEPAPHEVSLKFEEQLVQAKDYRKIFNQMVVEACNAADKQSIQAAIKTFETLIITFENSTASMTAAIHSGDYVSGCKLGQKALKDLDAALDHMNYLRTKDIKTRPEDMQLIETASQQLPFLRKQLATNIQNVCKQAGI